MLSLLRCLRQVGAIPEPNAAGCEGGSPDISKMTVGLSATAKAFSGSRAGLQHEFHQLQERINPLNGVQLVFKHAFA